ncbi:hypothetical protein B0A55_00802 [Friedmanniomyces simplex]|uniref:Uncharacterized protein n=1 Tax=Friedmanniomyces simplex TaxID=329884 RepID=A0A4U0Y2B9_9PEZI|nr:hypothetical protein B0A55_00802 [Friedmanniomyces simplex]
MEPQVNPVYDSAATAILRALGWFLPLLATVTALNSRYLFVAICPLVLVGALLFTLPSTGLFQRFMAAADPERADLNRKVKVKKPMRILPGSKAPGRQRRMQRRKEERQGRA